MRVNSDVLRKVSNRDKAMRGIREDVDEVMITLYWSVNQKVKDVVSKQTMRYIHQDTLSILVRDGIMPHYNRVYAHFSPSRTLIEI